jgi:glycosyltransferase involved in cell wall biosynthesis
MRCKLQAFALNTLREATADLANRLGIAAQVTFLGQRADIADVLGAADVFVLSSRWEGNPLSVMWTVPCRA